MRVFLGFAVAAALVACSGSSPTGNAAGGSTGSPIISTGTGGVSSTTGGIAPTTGGTPTGGAQTTGGAPSTTGGQCQTSWPPRACLAIAICECADGTEQDFGCVGPPTCGDACCGHGGPLHGAGLDDAGVCETQWPSRECQSESICSCADGDEEEFGCFGPPTCSEACCGHDGPGTDDAGANAPDSGVCQTWPPLACDAIFLCHCGDGMTEEAGCNGPPTCTDACCGHDGPPPGGAASDGGVCETSWPPRDCLAEGLCNCDDGSTQEFGCIGPPTCGDACCGHGGPGDGGLPPPDAGPADAGPPDAGPGTPDAGRDAGSVTPPSDGGSVAPPGDAGLAIDGGVCPYYPPLACGAIIACTCGDGTQTTAGCSGPPNCNDACCGHDGAAQNGG